MTTQQAKDFNKWLGGELDAYMDDNNITKLTDVPLERAVEEAKHSKKSAERWLDEIDDADEKKRLNGAIKFLKKYNKNK